MQHIAQNDHTGIKLHRQAVLEAPLKTIPNLSMRDMVQRLPEVLTQISHIMNLPVDKMQGGHIMKRKFRRTRVRPLFVLFLAHRYSN